MPVTYTRGERQKPTTRQFRNNYDQIDWSGNKPKLAKCSYANKYKGKRAPTCGCTHCESKWDIITG